LKIVFCTTCKGRAQHIERTLPRNLSENADYPDLKILLLDYASPDHLLPYLRANHAAAIESGRLVVYSMREPGPFRMAHAKNMCHRLAILEGADVLVNLDADNFSQPGFASWIAEQFSSGVEFLWSNAKSVCGRARQGLAGRIAVSRNLFLKTGGYDERYLDWAPEDEDFKARIRRLGCEGKPVEDRFLYVIPHGDGLRFREYPHAKPTPEREAAALKHIRQATSTISNYGNIGCGTVYRNFSDKPTELLPIPTRIFGIGMPKTGTTSLHVALKHLGIDSAHWTGPWWAKKVWEEMQTGRSVTLEKHQALSDLPFTMLFRELDKAYPGSKFILTTRDEERWVRSTRNHWDYKVNPWRASWDGDCFSHRMHNLFYGRKSFDAETMLARYRQHNAEVLEYFKHRQKDLLVMDMDCGAGWKELCTFLKSRVPNAPYPRAFVTAKDERESL
jgi:hypothetical protein